MPRRAIPCKPQPDSSPRSTGLPDLAAPFDFPSRYRRALELVRKEVRSFTTTSVGRLFDAAAALLGFTREITFEGQAAMWLEALARKAMARKRIPFRSRTANWIFARYCWPSPRTGSAAASNQK